ncbi:hypothetical protein SAMN04488009_1041 [Maribacter sedimenticola]|uniref:Uncharacterized protein n=1 Tax=Maribacter sedimenticola TaxID=228956 RepID=A0ABY1SED4_9FLAO|nr:hypothetical protein [Maribacter sedimenticola]SNR30192.1 hypothetical protein SAMN04488009_1041 [Maribacter sedimenticola]
MKSIFSKTFFVPLVILLSMLCLTSCGKDYDLVSEYVVRNATSNDLIHGSVENASFNVHVVNDPLEGTVKKK